MPCSKLEPQLTAYVLDELDQAGRRGVEAHLADCPDCRAELDEIRQTCGVLETELANEAASLSAGGLTANQRKAIGRTGWMASGRSGRGWRIIPLLLSSSLAASLLLAGFTAGWWIHARNVTAPPPEVRIQYLPAPASAESGLPAQLPALAPLALGSSIPTYTPNDVISFDAGNPAAFADNNTFTGNGRLGAYPGPGSNTSFISNTSAGNGMVDLSGSTLTNNGLLVNLVVRPANDNLPLSTADAGQLTRGGNTVEAPGGNCYTGEVALNASQGSITNTTTMGRPASTLAITGGPLDDATGPAAPVSGIIPANCPANTVTSGICDATFTIPRAGPGAMVRNGIGITQAPARGGRLIAIPSPAPGERAGSGEVPLLTVASPDGKKSVLVLRKMPLPLISNGGNNGDPHKVISIDSPGLYGLYEAEINP